MKQTQRVDKNGIPILDPPNQANKLPKKCHERMHLFTVCRTTIVETGMVRGELKDRVRKEKMCRICRHVEVEETWN